MRIIQAPCACSSARPPGATPSSIIIHDSGAGTAESTLSWFARPDSQASAHYLVGKDGTIYALVPEDRKAWHAGVSIMDGHANVNDYSLGIEITDVDDRSPYPPAQWEALVELTASLAVKYHIPIRRIVGHEHVAMPWGRKVDPGPDFDWFRFGLDVARRILDEGD
jgi:N-acetylmuramoyl-L-alanine amidase